MSNWRLVRLDFGRSPVHFGEVGIGIEETSERVRSDTLFSAWINAYVRLFGVDKVENLLKSFLESSTIPVRMSSTFIYRYQDNNFTYYLPCPLKFPPNYPEDDLAFFKSYKKLRYLPLKVWQRWYQGQGFTSDNQKELIKDIQKSNTDGDLKKAGAFDYGSYYKIDRFPKVAIDRVTRATNFYHTGFTQFIWEKDDNGKETRSGLYFLLNFSEIKQQLENKLQAALNLLGDEGLGGERSSGAGRFQVEYWGNLSTDWQEVVNFKEETHQYCLLSLFWQKSLDASFLNDSSYEIIERGGWIGSPYSGRQLRRKKVHMFAEGSVFASEPLGELANVTPEEFRKNNGEYKPHAIYRNGISISIPIKVKI
jgi:CRISPR-associated protein Csm4